MHREIDRIKIENSLAIPWAVLRLSEISAKETFQCFSVFNNTPASLLIAQVHLEAVPEVLILKGFLYMFSIHHNAVVSSFFPLPHISQLH